MPIQCTTSLPIVNILRSLIIGSVCALYKEQDVRETDA